MFSVATRLPSIRNSTLATRESSLASACSSSERVKCAPAVGDVIATFGAALAGGAGAGDGVGDGAGEGEGDGVGVGTGVEPPSGPAADVPTRARSKYSV